jgi:hypothetical protein
MTDARLTFPLAARIVREAEAVRDKSYRKFPIGEEWGRFLRAKRLASCAQNTLLSYETVGRLLTLRYADFDSLEPFAERETGVELVLDFIDRYWGEADEATRRQRLAVLASFFEWAYRTDRISADPMRKIERPRRRAKAASGPRIPAGPLARLVAGQDSLRDQAAILLLGRLGYGARTCAFCRSRTLTLPAMRSTCATRKAATSMSSRSASRTCATRCTCTCRRRGASRRSFCSTRRRSARGRSHAPASRGGSTVAASGPALSVTRCASYARRPPTTSGARREAPATRRRSCGTSL